jgi:hypothetical protein
MKKYKVFASLLGLLLLAYCVFNLAVWNIWVQTLLDDPGCPGGDLTRLGYIDGSKMARQHLDDLPVRHIELDQYHGQPVDVITLGDSFSHGGGFGRNSYYQDYLASFNNLSVLNIPELRDMDKVSEVSLLLNNGYLDRIKPKILLIECAEKKCVGDLPDSYNFDRTVSQQEYDRLETVKYNEPPTQKPGLISLGFFSEGNFKFVRNNLLYRFSDNAYGSQVYKARLDRAFFTVPEPKTLLYFYAEMKYLSKITPQKIARLNDGLNVLHDRLAAKGIELYFMPCVDKYNLYSGYIVNNKHPRSIFFEQLRKLPKRYRFIDTKALLSEELEKGVKDLFYADDTHWSWKASEKIFKSVRFTH